MIELEPLLADCAVQPPCGPNLEYDPAFQELELAARGRPEQVIGDTRIEAVPPDWPAVERLAVDLLARTKDIRIVALLTRALTRMDGVAGLRAGVALQTGMLQRYWDEVHPRPDDGDFTMRLNALAAFADPGAMLADIRRALVAQVPRKGRVTVRDVLLAAGRLQPDADDTAQPPALVEGLIRDAAAADAAPIEAARDVTSTVRALHDVLADRVGLELAADLLPLLDLLQPVSALCARLLSESAQQASVPARDLAGAAPDGPVGQPPFAGGELRSRDDALSALDRICEFIERIEPANPAPLFIRRARRLMGMNFVEVIEELAPDSLPGIKSLAGIRGESR